jgi:hypothetical protein
MSARFWFKAVVCELLPLLFVLGLLEKAGQWPFGARSLAGVVLFGLCWFGLKRVFLAVVDVVGIYLPSRKTATGEPP